MSALSDISTSMCWYKNFMIEKKVAVLLSRTQIHVKNIMSLFFGLIFDPFGQSLHYYFPSWLINKIVHLEYVTLVKWM